MRESLLQMLSGCSWFLPLLLSIESAQAAGAPLQFKTEESVTLPWGAIWMLALLALIALFIGIAIRRRRDPVSNRLLRWLPAQPDADVVSILGSRRLAGKVWLHVLEWEGGKVLVAINDQQIVTLDRGSINMDRAQESSQ